jgi:hypothetical protein
MRLNTLCSVVLALAVPATSQARTLPDTPAVSGFIFERDLPSVEDSITLYIVPPPARLSWDSPKSLARSTVWSSIRSGYHSIGHVTVQTSCRLSTGARISFWTGMTASDDNPADKDLLIREKIGLGILFYPFKGRIERPAELYRDIVIASTRINRLFTLRFLVTPEQCDRVHAYYRGYVSSGPKGYGQSFRPRHLEGAGCTAYAASYLEVAGILTPEIKESWSKSLRVPKGAIGTSEEPVKLTELLFKKRFSRWAEEHEPHVPLFIYDTQFMFDWSQKLMAEGLPEGISRDDPLEKSWRRQVRVEGPPHEGDIKRSNGFYGLRIDARHIPVATDPIWQGRARKPRR